MVLGVGWSSVAAAQPAEDDGYEDDDFQVSDDELFADDADAEEPASDEGGTTPDAPAEGTAAAASEGGAEGGEDELSVSDDELFADDGDGSSSSSDDDEVDESSWTDELSLKYLEKNL